MKTKEIENQEKIFPPEIIQFTAEHHFVTYHSQSKIIYSVIIISIIAAIVALPFISIDISSQSRGIVRSPSENNKLQAVVSGEVVYNVIEENQKIRKGDTLLIVRTDKIDEQIAAAISRKEDNLQNINDIHLLMLNSTPNGYKFQSEYNEFMTKKRELNVQLQYAKKELERAEMLFRNKITPELEYLQIKNRYELALKQLELSLNEYRNKWQAEKKRIELENIDLNSTIVQLNKEKRNYVLIAPTDGAIIQSAGVQNGSFITPGQILGYLSQDNRLMAECYIKPSDIGFIKPNQKVLFQFDAFNYREWGMMQGFVTEISNDIVTVNDNQSAFRVRCTLCGNTLSLKNGYIGNVKKGMTVTGQFYLTRRTLAQLLFDKIDNWMNPKLTNLK